jgi:hypothetical protein
MYSGVNGNNSFNVLFGQVGSFSKVSISNVTPTQSASGAGLGHFATRSTLLQAVQGQVVEEFDGDQPG